VGLQQADDFKLIRGIGPAIERRLHNAGIRTFADLAALSPDGIAASLAGLSAKRIAKENWLGQARRLASKRASARPRKEALAFWGRQHYETFTVELLLDENNDVRRTRVTHIQSRDEGKWADWQDTQLLDFFIEHAALRLPPVERAPAVAATAKLVPPVAATTEHPPSPTTTASLLGVFRLRSLEIVQSDTDRPDNVLRHNHPFTVRLTLDLTDVRVSPDIPLSYTVTIYAKRLGRPRQIIGETQGNATPANTSIINVKDVILSPGRYRVQVVATLTPFSPEIPPRPGLVAWLEGGLLHVY